MDASRIEQQCTAASLRLGTVRVAEDNRIRLRKAPAQEFRQRLVRMQIAEAERPQQRLRFLHPAAPIAVDEHDAPALDRELAAQRQRRQMFIVVASHRFDWSDAFESRDRLRSVDITSVQDEIHPAKRFEDSIRETIEELRAVRVRDDPNPRGHAGVRVGCALRVSSTSSGARLSTAAIAKITGCPRPNATAPMRGPMTPPT